MNGTNKYLLAEYWLSTSRNPEAASYIFLGGRTPASRVKLFDSLHTSNLAMHELARVAVNLSTHLDTFYHTKEEDQYSKMKSMADKAIAEDKYNVTFYWYNVTTEKMEAVS